MRPLTERYARAEQCLPWNLKKLVRNARVEPYWIGTTDLFWYRRHTKEGHEFVLHDPECEESRPAFDHAAVAERLSAALGQELSPDALPFELLTWTSVDGPIRFEANGRLFEWDRTLTEVAAPAFAGCELPSPDGRFAVFKRDYNLWVRETASGRTRQLTFDGEPGLVYGGTSGSDCHPVTRKLNPGSDRPRAIWSADSRRLLTHQLDERNVRPLHLLQTIPADGGVRPRLHSFPYSFPGDKCVAQVEFCIIDLEAGSLRRFDRGKRHGAYIAAIDREFIWWGESDRRIYWLDFERGHGSVTFREVNAESGISRDILTESSPTYVELNLDMAGRPNVRELAGGCFLWQSERDGWAHLYLIDGTGRVIRQITHGEWAVRDIVAVDASREELWFTATGRESGDPYFRYLYRASLDGSWIELLTPECADHDIMIPPTATGAGSGVSPIDASSLSPSRRWLVETYSTPDSAPVAMLRQVAAPRHARVLERCDTKALEAWRWRWPEPFEAKAADGATTIYGTLFLPSDFDPDGSYPVLDYVYPGPQTIQTSKSSFNKDDMRFFMYATAQAQAELGFAVVTVDGRGTPYRSKAWHDAGYGRLQDAGGIDDRLAAIRQLASTRRFLDLDRLGVVGHSGGGYAATRAVLAYPETFKAAYASCPTQDMSCYISDWGEKYQGPYSPDLYASQDNARLAHRLEAPLMLVWGEMDDNVHYVGNHRLVQALADAQKDFEMLVIPTGNHWFALHMGYVHRRQWDFFVRHLLKKDPPRNIVIADNPDFPASMRLPRPPVGWLAR